ncbi:cobyrinate a,c-diamide synthase [Halodesulfovibrio marinisediminis]|uniref:Cobyrinate a,c-diamide synthase n=1 Tax=Halodesulfovibrio marinisediminis DSM 17456 TaxID=1121457 RepID=A0A1N6F4R8_9BACT|nr:cobyrinate a,c-diamide synthase [Halodesulfovibrio marinisediminis]SIN90206.1 cobyrinic acid a,c-diamide synthase [Halodesulfovibrio marinisediminis DSM 17456]
MAKTIVIGGTQSGSGKTLVSLAIMAALTRRGLHVQPFKCGPDFIDPGLHKAVTGNNSINLDGWMLPKGANIATYNNAMSPKKGTSPDIAVIEGVMGLFDGASGSEDSGSTAQIAKWLDAHVLLVIDGRSMARSFAAIAHGFTTLDPDLTFAGCIANRVGSPNHVSLIREAMQTYCPEILLAGCLPRNDDITLPSRHLGLVTAEEGVLNSDRIAALADWANDNIDFDHLLSQLPEHHFSPIETCKNKDSSATPVRIAVATDAAFCFCYPDNLRLLEENGAEIIHFSPLKDSSLPEKIDGLYLPGGYPELYAERLSLNASMRSAIRDFSQSGRPVYAECGGFMYLAQEIRTETATYPMCNVFDVHCTMDKRHRALGYREIKTTANSILGSKNTTARGHEFHYSFAKETTAHNSLYTVTDRKGIETSTSGYATRNTVGSYVHLHFASQPSVAKAIVDACIRTRTLHD